VSFFHPTIGTVSLGVIHQMATHYLDHDAMRGVLLNLNNNKGQSLLSLSHKTLTVQLSIHQARESADIIHSITANPFISLIRKHCPSNPVTITNYFSVPFRTRETHALFFFLNGP
jgi:hypothetical protein